MLYAILMMCILHQMTDTDFDLSDPVAELCDKLVASDSDIFFPPTIMNDSSDTGS